MGSSASAEERVSLLGRGFWKRNLGGTVQVAIMCHARKKAPGAPAQRHRGGGEQAQRARVGADAFGRCATTSNARWPLKTCWGERESTEEVPA